MRLRWLRLGGVPRLGALSVWVRSVWWFVVVDEVVV